MQQTKADQESRAPLVTGDGEVDGRPPDKLAGTTSRASFSLQLLIQEFGHRLLVLLFVAQHVLKGFANSFLAPCTRYLLASYKVKGPQMQVYGGVIALPWSMKPVIGLVSDAVPLAGYHKAPYIIIVSVMASVACAAIGAVPQAHFSIQCLVLCNFALMMQFSTCDLLTEAKYAEQMQSKPEHGPALMTFVWFGLYAGGLVATILIGPIMSHFGTKMPFLIAIVPVSLIILPVAANYLEETAVNSEQLAITRSNLSNQREACVLCLLMFVSTVMLTVLGIVFQNVRLNALAAIIVAVVMLISFSIVLRPVIAKVNAFFLIQTSLGISIGGASFYFFTDNEDQYPEGPHFSKEFFVSVLGVLGSVCSLIGVCSYQRYATGWTYQQLLMFTNIVNSVLSVSDLLIFTRLNLRLGIPDHAFVIGSNVMSEIVSQWMWMPGVVILSQLCPKGMEATMYALLAGCHNLGITISSNVGAAILQWLDCQPRGDNNESEQFKNLWVGAALGIFLPMLTLVMIPCLIPNTRQTDKLLEDGDVDATAGSLLKKWRGESTPQMTPN